MRHGGVCKPDRKGQNVYILWAGPPAHIFTFLSRGWSYRMIGFQWFFLLTKWWGRVHQPPLFIIPPFCTEVYLARMFDFFSWVWILLACLELVPQKRHHFVRTCFSTISLRFSMFFSIVIKEQPILFVRKWAQWYVRPVFICNVEEKWSVHIPASFA